MPFLQKVRSNPLIGATKPEQVIEAAQTARIPLSAEDLEKLETAAQRAGVDTRGSWEHPML